MISIAHHYPEALLEFMDNIDSDFSDDEFDGYISDEETTQITGTIEEEKEEIIVVVMIQVMTIMKIMKLLYMTK